MGLNSKIDFERTNLELFMERKKLTQRSFHISIRIESRDDCLDEKSNLNCHRKMMCNFQPFLHNK